MINIASFFKKSGRIKKESLNYHFVLIEAPEEIVGPEVILWGEAPWWPQKCSMRFIRRSIGKLALGTEYEQRVVPLGPHWNVRVTRIVPDREIERSFLNGMFRGKETVKIEGRYNGTKVNYLMQFEVKGILNKILWVLLFRRLHDRNVEMILVALKNYVLQKMNTAEEQ